MRIELDKALVVLHHLVEGTSVRATMRLTGVNRNTILDLLALMGERCERLLAGRIKNVPVVDVQADEIWGFVKMKEKTRASEQPRSGGNRRRLLLHRHRAGDELILAWHLGRRSPEDTHLLRGQARRSDDAANSKSRPTATGRTSPPSRRRWQRPISRSSSRPTRRRTITGTRRAKSTAPSRRPANGNPDPDRIMHVARRAPEPDDPDGQPADDPADECVQQEVGEPRGGWRSTSPTINFCRPTRR